MRLCRHDYLGGVCPALNFKTAGSLFPLSLKKGRII